MTFRCPRSAAMLLAGILLVPGILAEPASATTDLAPLTPRFEAVVDRALRQCRVPGAVVGVPIRVSSAVHTAASIIIPITVVTTATSRHPRWTAIPARAGHSTVRGAVNGPS